MEYWLAEKGSLLVWLLPLGSLVSFLFAWFLFQSWRSGIVGGLTIPATIFYAFWVAGAEEHVSFIEIVGLFAIVIVSGFLAGLLGNYPERESKEQELANG